MSEILDDQKIAVLYAQGLAQEAEGDVRGAIATFRQVLALDPDDHGGVSVRLAALGEAALTKAPAAYVATLFDQMAPGFEHILVNQLDYHVPDLLPDIFAERELEAGSRALDLGCGTGLVADAMEEFGLKWTGVDLSPQMVDAARELELYDHLAVAEAESFLRGQAEGRYTLIVAADMVPYFGALEELFDLVATRLAPKGWFAFSTQSLPDGAEDAYAVGSDHRFAHGQAYVEHAIAQSQMHTVFQRDINVRNEDGQPTPGQLIVVRN